MHAFNKYLPVPIAFVTGGGHTDLNKIDTVLTPEELPVEVCVWKAVHNTNDLHVVNHH